MLATWERRLHLQRCANTCGVASLRTVLDLQYQIDIPEAALEAYGTHPDAPIRTHGVGRQQLRAILKRANAHYNVFAIPWRLLSTRNGTIGGLRRAVRAGCFPILQIQHDDEFDHNVVVLEVQRGRTIVFNPAEGVEVIPNRELMRQWLCNRERWYGVVVDGFTHHPFKL